MNRGRSHALSAPEAASRRINSDVTGGQERSVTANVLNLEDEATRPNPTEAASRRINSDVTGGQERSVTEDLKVLTERLGFEFVGLSIVHEAGTQVLRLYIDREGGVTLDDCERVSTEADVLLDTREQDFDDNYLLEVSSPGIERPLFKLEDYSRFVGNAVLVKLREPCQGRRRVSAVIGGILEENVLLNCEGEEMRVPFSSISSAHLVYIEEKGQKKTFKKKGGKR